MRANACAELIIDGGAPIAMTPPGGVDPPVNDPSLKSGITFTHSMTLAQGSHTYSFTDGQGTTCAKQNMAGAPTPISVTAPTPTADTEADTETHTKADAQANPEADDQADSQADASADSDARRDRRRDGDPDANDRQRGPDAQPDLD